MQRQQIVEYSVAFNILPRNSIPRITTHLARAQLANSQQFPFNISNINVAAAFHNFLISELAKCFTCQLWITYNMIRRENKFAF